MSVYVDADVLASLFSPDANTGRASAAMASIDQDVVASDFACAEFASVVAKRVRMRALTVAQGRRVLATFDEWVSSHVFVAPTEPGDISQCAKYLRRLDLPLRTPDALHIAIASRLRAPILSFDRNLLSSARRLGVPTA